MSSPMVCLWNHSTFFTIFTVFCAKIGYVSIIFRARCLFCLDFRAENWQMLRICHLTGSAALCFVPVMNWLYADWKPLEAYGSTVGCGICLFCCRSRSCCDLALVCPWKIQDALVDVSARLKMDTDFISKWRKTNLVVGEWNRDPFPCQHFGLFPYFWSPGDRFSLPCDGVIAIVKLPERVFCFLIPAWELWLLLFPAADTPAISAGTSLCFFCCVAVDWRVRTLCHNSYLPTEHPPDRVPLSSHVSGTITCSLSLELWAWAAPAIL